MVLIAGRPIDDIESGRLTKDDIMALASFHGLEAPDFHNTKRNQPMEYWLGDRMSWVLERYSGKERLKL